ncbi:DUF6985 domain-containing protein [Lysinibacillus sp. 3P01SB]|uniref:DUF6985 domain-containing protein n=1 Tax=Lysinibacillus sp. 3P01SB TaxID=3132284 RepID=UPI0039A640DF
MSINDKVFGELEFNYDWVGYKNMNFCGKDAEIAIMISGEEDGKFDDNQYAAYKYLIENWSGIQQIILKSIFDYYKKRRHELGYDVEYNESYPLLETPDQLLEKIMLVGVIIPNPELFEFLDTGIMFDCAWDPENGVGVRLIKGEVVKVGFQDIVM